MNQVGFVFRVVLSFGFFANSINLLAQAAPPPDMPSQEAIQRLMEEERLLRMQAVNDPVTKETIAARQRLDSALVAIDRKSQIDLVTVRQLAQLALEAARNADAISRYRHAIQIELDFKTYVNAQFQGGLLLADHPIYIKALATLDLSMRDIHAGYLR